MRKTLFVLNGWLVALCLTGQTPSVGSDQPFPLRQVAISEAALSLGIFENTPYPKFPDPPPVVVDYKIPSEVADNEKVYTIEWLRKLLRDEFVPEIENLHCLTGLPPGFDDAVASVWTNGRYRLQLLDSRVLCLTFSVPQKTIGEVEILFKEAFFFDYGNPSYVTVECTVLRHIGLQESSGEIRVKRPSGWIEPPVLWYKTPNSVTFVLQKEIAYPMAKGGAPLDIASELVGGCTLDSTGSFLRFSHANRKALAIARLLQLHALQLREMRQQMRHAGVGGDVRAVDDFR